MPYGSLEAKIAAEAERYIDLMKKTSDKFIIDAHAHFGKDNFWPNTGNVDMYINKAIKNGIGACFAMSVPCPVLKYGSSEIILSYYEQEGKEFKHYTVDKKSDKFIKTPHLTGINPYERANDIIYYMTQKRKDFRFYYVPLLHPKYYSEEDIIKQINRGAKIFKIHGVACGIDPKQIDEEFFRLLEKYNIKLIIHTDYSEKENILSKNSAMNWISVLQKYNINVYFAHAVRLDYKAIDIINNDCRYIIGIGPDKLLGKDGQNYIDTDYFLEYCFRRFKEDKIVFDTDYPWNIQDRDDYRFDWESPKRIKSLLDDKKAQKVLAKNIINFIK